MTDVDFGYKKVAPEEKTRLVRGVFESVAENYDLMNDLMSFGSHRLLKRMTLEMSGVRAGHRVLDLAGGTGDLAALFAPVVGDEGRVVLTDINGEMMRVGRDRLLDRGLTQVSFCQANGEQLPFADGSFNCITIGFGLRNFTDTRCALAHAVVVHLSFQN
jgi:demethylmenaquinone methyltransferase/2-methoxy-6-polyprenyl-1,4-benzoquinol methylase